jgi:ATP-dependent protease HslVU (ClpYQ) peptidase subunit
MAADGKVSFDQGDYIVHTRRKILRVGEALVGSCGDLRDGEKFVRWLTDGRNENKTPKLGDEFLALVLSPSGILLFDEECAVIEIEKDYHAIGSGEQAARTMLSLGHSPRAAVRKAIEFDNGSGPPIVVMKLKR